MINEIELLKSQGFNLASTTDAISALAINKHFSFSKNIISESKMEYCMLDNILYQPDLFVDLLKKYPVFNFDPEYWSSASHIPGFRQRIANRDLLPLIKLWSNAYFAIKNKSFPFIFDWHCATNIYVKDMKINLIPHVDGDSFVSNMWLMKNMSNCGTGFYKLKMNGKEYYRFSTMTPNEKTQYLEIDSELRKKPYPWRPWEPNEYWELYATIPSIYNSSLLYEGDFFHQGIFDEKNWPENIIRYSLVSFLWNTNFQSN